MIIELRVIPNKVISSVNPDHYDDDDEDDNGDNGLFGPKDLSFFLQNP